MNTETVLLILRLLDLLASVAIRSTAVQAEFSRLQGEIETMVREGRGPTAQEWNVLNSRADSLHAQLQGLGSDGNAD